MRIRPSLADGIRLLENGAVVFARFTAIAEQRDADPPARVEMEVAVDAWGRPTCRRLTIEPLEDGGAVSASDLRGVPLDHFLRQATATAASWLGHARQVDGGLRFDALTASERASTKEAVVHSARKPRRGSPDTEDHLREVADVVRQAECEGELPASAVAERWDLSQPTAYRHIQAAKARGLLLPSGA